MRHFSACMLNLEDNTFDSGTALEHILHSKFSRSFAEAVAAFSVSTTSSNHRRKSFESSRSSFFGIQSSSMAQMQSPFPRSTSPLPTSDSPVELTQGYVEDWQHAPGFLTPFPLGRPSFAEPSKVLHEAPSFYQDDVATAETAIQIIVDGGVTASLHTLSAPVLQYCLTKRCSSVRNFPSERSSSAVFQFINRPDLATPVQPRKMTHPTPSFSAGKQIVDGCQLDDPALLLRFPHDCRLPLVQSLLRSCRAIKIRSLTTAESEVPDAYQKRLWLLAQRTLALPVGRGALTFSSSQPLPTEAMPVPPLMLIAKVPPADAVIKLDLATVGATSDVYTWPEFHNGTAAALRLSPEQTHISRFWIVNHRRPELSNDRWGGFLLGLGLQGHLSVLSRTSYVKILGKNEAYPSVACGLMLGACASGRGTMNTNLQNLLAPNVSSLSVETRDAKSSVVQNACLVAIGLLYEGTYNRLIIDKLVDWITVDGSLCTLGDREASAVSAALGLGYACAGSAVHRNSTLLKSRIRDRLSPFVCIGERSSLSASAPAIVLPTRYSGRNGAGMSVVSPAACLALGLCFWNTADSTVIDCLRLPSEKSRMDFIRPDIALLRVMACALVEWSNVSPTSEWVMSMVPPFLLQFVSGVSRDCPLGEFSPIHEKHLRSLFINACVGACLAIGIRYAGSANSHAQEFLLLSLQQICSRRTKLEARPSKATLYLYETGISVMCLSLAMVMAGTGDSRCLGLFSAVRSRVDADVSYGDHMARNMAIGWLFAGGARVSFSTNLSAVVSLVAACFPVFPRNPTDNRYHLQALRHLYVLAFEHRCLETREVGEDIACCVPVQITVRQPDGSDSIQLGCTPILMPPWASVVKIQLASDRYWCEVVLFVLEFA
jgi:anaphase-promoting complex subunit 1